MKDTANMTYFVINVTNHGTLARLLQSLGTDHGASRLSDPGSLRPAISPEISVSVVPKIEI